MKKVILLFILFVFIPICLHAVHIDLGIMYGLRTVKDADIKNIYGNGTVYYPCAAVNIKGFFVGGAYEGGYKKNGKIGIYEESTTLKVQGFELYIGYQHKFHIIAPFIKLGYGFFSYKQSINSPVAGDYKVDHKKSVVTVSAGLKTYLMKNFYLAGEFRYIPLKVKPFEDTVDLSGIRILAGIGASF